MLLRDPVHGLIEFEGGYEKVLRLLLDTGEVQRLRRVTQLGMTNFAFPGAEHSRFTHAVGAASVMMQLHQHIVSIQDILPVDQRLTEEAKLDSFAAALIHDLGHGPFSHLFEEVIFGEKTHEDWTSEIILSPTTEIYRALESFSSGMSKRVVSLLQGTHELTYLTRAVSGVLDVDRCDYLLRDSLLTGVQYGLFDLDWLLRSLIFIETPSKKWVLGIDGKKGLPSIESFFLGRHFMYQQVYHHKTTRASEAIFRGLLAEVTEGLKNDEKLKVPKALYSAIIHHQIDLDAYLCMDDHEVHACFSAWEESKHEPLKTLATQVRKRRLPKTLDLTPVQFENKDQIFDQACRVANSFGIGSRHIWIDAPSDIPFEENPQTDDTIWVLRSDASVSTLGSASFILGQIKNKQNIHPRLIFPSELREPFKKAFS